jgi:hypothetical protein
MTEKKQGGWRAPVNESALIPQVASLLAVGKSPTVIAQELNIGFNTVKRLATLDATKAMIKEIGDSAMSVAKALIKKRIGDSVEIACEVLTEHLKEERSLDAVKLVFKVAGALTDEPVQAGTGNQTLQIIMPGAAAEKPAIEVEHGSMDLRPSDENDSYSS